MAWTVDGVGDTPATVLVASDRLLRPAVMVAPALTSHSYNPAESASMSVSPQAVM